MEYKKNFSRRDGDNKRPHREGGDSHNGQKPFKKYNVEDSDRPRRPRGNDDDRNNRRPYRSSDDDRSNHRSYRSSDDDRNNRRLYRSSDEERNNRRSYRSNDDNRSNYRSNDEDRPRRQYNNDRDDHSRRPYQSNDKDRSRRSFHSDNSDRPRRSFSKNSEEHYSRQNDRKFKSESKRYGQRKFNDMDDDEFENLEYSNTRSARPNRERKTGNQSSRPENAGTTRLNKYISNAGICSRRDADKLIAAGSVTVNGKVVSEMGYKVLPGDVVAYDGETLKSERKRYFLLNKPKGYITTADDPQERKTVMMLIDGACPERLYPVGRLDRNTTGLLLFTNDGELAKKLTHPSTGIYKIYHVELDKPVTREDMKKMYTGIELEDGPIQVDDVQYAGTGDDKRVVGVELHSGRNRIVRRIFESLGYDVHKLDRVVFAGLTKKDLPRGRYRELSEKEISFLKMI